MVSTIIKQWAMSNAQRKSRMVVLRKDGPFLVIRKGRGFVEYVEVGNSVNEEWHFCNYWPR